jgi:hypothetical protein
MLFRDRRDVGRFLGAPSEDASRRTARAQRRMDSRGSSRNVSHIGV